MWWFAVVGLASAAAPLEVVSSNKVLLQAEWGSEVRGVVDVLNPNAEVARGTVYLRDMMPQASGVLSFPEPGSHARSNAAWIETSAQQIEVGPGQRLSVGWVVRVPSEGESGGTYWSGLMVESEPEASGVSGPTKIEQVVRHCVRIAVELPGGDVNLGVVGRRVESVDERARLTIDVRNGGSSMVDAVAQLQVVDAVGTQVLLLQTKTQTLYPGVILPFRFDLGTVPAGRYTAIVTAEAAGRHTTGAQFALELH